MGDTALIGGGIVTVILLLAFQVFRVVSNDNRWEALFTGVQKDLENCRASEGRLHERIDNLESEVSVLREQLHRAGWMGDEAHQSAEEP